jgi:hypothetical protein
VFQNALITYNIGKAAMYVERSLSRVERLAYKTVKLQIKEAKTAADVYILKKALEDLRGKL